MSIKVLSSQVAANIAAGEVVERPASIVKELIENSLDAEASAIDVEVKDGGLGFIQVSDNGVGITRVDTDYLFFRHATSKLTSVEDLEIVKTLGFRGEALYSIAAVSKTSIWTHSVEEEVGSFVTAAAGGEFHRIGWGGPPGTTVKVDGLFSKFPARRKFLKSSKVELARIQSALVPYVLSNPSVRFALRAEGRIRLESRGSGIYKDAAASVYGRETAGDLLDIETNPMDEVKISGLIGSPRIHRGTRSYISLFINGRPIQSTKLGYAVIEAYGGFLPIGRFPFATIFITVDWDQVDVNVHPAKREVRFKSEDQVFRAIQQSVRNTLVNEAPVPGIQLNPSSSVFAPTPNSFDSRIHFSSSRKRISWSGAHQSLSGVSDIQVAPNLFSMTPSQVLPILRVVGQVHETYIVAEGPDGIFLIDQHAAHERVLYTDIAASVKSNRPSRQGLLEPTLVELSAEQDATVGEQSVELDRYGWLLEEFGKRTYVLRAIPTTLGTSDPSTSFIDFLDGIMGLQSQTSWGHKIAATLACHGSVRAGKTMNNQEMVSLIDMLGHVDQPHTCPHGRPSIIHLSTWELAKEFRRG